MEHVVITGADGFIGSNLTRYFVKNNFFVYAVVSPESKTTDRISNIRNVRVIVNDLKNAEQIAGQIDAVPIALIHLAWAGVSPEERRATNVQVQNITLALQSVKLAHLIHAQRFIFPGSTMEYSYCGGLINESAKPSPQNAYGAAKISARYLCESLCKELHVPYVYIVITGIYGSDRYDNNVITYTIRSLLAGEKPRYTKLEQMWDYIHIDDLVEAILQIAQKGRAGAFYSIGHGDNWPLYKYVNIIHNLIDPSLPLGIGEIPYTDGRMPSSCMDLTALKKDTGFCPKIPFDKGIQQVILKIKEELYSSEEK